MRSPQGSSTISQVQSKSSTLLLLSSSFASFRICMIQEDEGGQPRGLWKSVYCDVTMISCFIFSMMPSAMRVILSASHHTLYMLKHTNIHPGLTLIHCALQLNLPKYCGGDWIIITDSVVFLPESFSALLVPGDCGSLARRLQAISKCDDGLQAALVNVWF